MVIFRLTTVIKIWIYDCAHKEVTSGNGCVLVGRVVASDTRDLPFKSSHYQTWLIKTIDR